MSPLRGEEVRRRREAQTVCASSPLPTARRVGTIHQDAAVFAAVLEDGREVSHELRPGRHAWYRWRGRVELNGRKNSNRATARPRATRSGLSSRAAGPAEVLLFDLTERAARVSRQRHWGRHILRV